MNNILTQLSLLASLFLLALLSQSTHSASDFDAKVFRELKTASCKGEAKRVKKLLKCAKPEVHARILSFSDSEDDLTLLQCAVKNGHLKVVSVLLKDKWYNEDFTPTMNIALQNKFGENAVQIAISGKSKILKMLLNTLASESILTSLNNNDELTPLMLASSQGRYKAVKLLLKRFPLSEHVKVQRSDGGTALLYAIKAGSADVVKLLLDYDLDNGAAKQSLSSNTTFHSSPFLHACLGENPAIISALLNVPSLYQDILVDDSEFNHFKLHGNSMSTKNQNSLKLFLSILDLWIRLRCESAIRLGSTANKFSGQLSSNLVFTQATVAQFLGSFKSNI